jgi:hypothetical protein
LFPCSLPFFPLTHLNNRYPPELFSFFAIVEKKKLRKKETSSLRSLRPSGGAERRKSRLTLNLEP